VYTVEAELESYLDQQKRQQISSIPSIKFKTAFVELSKKHGLLDTGIEKIDSSLQLTPGDGLVVVGNRKYLQAIITRLCVNALLSLPSKKRINKREADFYTPNLILVDAGNSTDFYQYVHFTRQYFRRDIISRVLNNTLIIRCFTVYQLADVIINQLPKVIQQYDAKMVVVSDLLDMFVRDPQIETNEATYLINEIVNSITKSIALEDVLLVVSLPFRNVSSNYDNVRPCISYNKMVLTRFNKSMKIIDKENNMIDIKIKNNNEKTNGVYNGKLLSINKREILIVSTPAK
jgi:hypothetical protein